MPQIHKSHRATSLKVDCSLLMPLSAAIFLSKQNGGQSFALAGKCNETSQIHQNHWKAEAPKTSWI